MVTQKDHTVLIQMFELIFYFRDPNLSLTEAPALQPAEAFLAADEIQRMNDDLNQAAQMELPEGDEADF